MSEQDIEARVVTFKIALHVGLKRFAEKLGLLVYILLVLPGSPFSISPQQNRSGRGTLRGRRSRSFVGRLLELLGGIVGEFGGVKLDLPGGLGCGKRLLMG